MFELIHSANVYTPNGTDGDFTTLSKSALTCRLALIQQGPAAVGGEREDQSLKRRLLWEEAYTMPDDAQIEIDGQRWAVLVGTYTPVNGVGGNEVYRRCEVLKVV